MEDVETTETSLEPTPDPEDKVLREEVSALAMGQGWPEIAFQFNPLTGKPSKWTGPGIITWKCFLSKNEQEDIKAAQAALVNRGA